MRIFVFAILHFSPLFQSFSGFGEVSARTPGALPTGACGGKKHSPFNNC
jgi:hypothetical protein